MKAEPSRLIPRKHTETLVLSKCHYNKLQSFCPPPKTSAVAAMTSHLLQAIDRPTAVQQTILQICHSDVDNRVWSREWAFSSTWPGSEPAPPAAADTKAPRSFFRNWTEQRRVACIAVESAWQEVVIISLPKQTLTHYNTVAHWQNNKLRRTKTYLFTKIFQKWAQHFVSLLVTRKLPSFCEFFYTYHCWLFHACCSLTQFF